MKTTTESVKSSKVVAFNSRRTVMFVRIMQIIMPVLFLVVLSGEHNALPWIVTGAALLFFEIFMFSMVLATLNEKGLSYLRWGKWKQLNWYELAYGGPGLVGFYRVKVLRRPVWNRYLLLRNPESKSGENLSLRTEVIHFLKAIEPVSGRTN